MRKITISVASLLAAVAVQTTFAEAVVWPTTSISMSGSETVTLNGFTFFGNDGKTSGGASITSSGFYTGGSSSSSRRYVYFTPSADGILTFGATPSGSSERYVFVATSPTSDQTTAIEGGCLAVPTKGTSYTTSVQVKGGTTYYICAQGNMTINVLEYAASGDSESETPIIKAGETETSTTLSLVVGSYSVEAPDGYTVTVTSEDGTDVYADATAVVITSDDVDESGYATIKVTVTAAAAVEADTEVEVNAYLYSSDLQKVKDYYSLQLTEIINQADVYTNDATMQELALQASKFQTLIEESLGLDYYKEYVTTGQIAAFEEQLSSLKTAIANASAVYNNYVYAQTQYGQTYDSSTATYIATDPASGILAAKATLDANYNAASADVQALVADAYANVESLIDSYVENMDAEYAAATYTDEDEYQKIIDDRVAAITAAIESVQTAIDEGTEDAAAKTDVTTAIETARSKYNDETAALYSYLITNESAIENNKTVYTDLYSDAISEYQTYNKLITAAETARDAGTLTKEDAATIIATLDPIIGTDDETADFKAIADKYEEIADTQRALYAKTESDVSALESSLKTQVTDVLPTAIVSEFQSEIDAITADINSLASDAQTAYKAHSLEADETDGVDGTDYTDGYGITDYTTNYEAIVAAIEALATKAEAAADNYNAKVAAEATIADLQKTLDEAKATVDANQYPEASETETVTVEYSQTDKFDATEATLQAAVDAITTALEAAYAEGTAVTYTESAAYTDSVAAVKDDIATYQYNAENALTQYNDMAESIASATEALATLKETATYGNTTSTIDNANGTIEGHNGMTYDAIISEYSDSIAKVQVELATAAALSDTAHVEAMAALETLENLIADINADVDQYESDYNTYVANQRADAVAKLRDEAQRYVNALTVETVASNETYSDTYYTVVTGTVAGDKYEFNTYGLKYEALNDSLTAITTIKTAQEAAIASATGATNEDLAILQEVVDALASANTSFAALQDSASTAKTAYAAEKAQYKTFDTTLEDYLAQYNAPKDNALYFDENGSNAFAAEITAQTDSIGKLQTKIDGLFAEETVVENASDLQKEIDALTANLAGIKELVANAQANETANDDFDEYELMLEVKIDDDNTVVGIQNAIDAIDAVVDASELKDLSEDAYNYYKGVVDGYQTEYEDIEAAQEIAYGNVTTSTVAGAIATKTYTDVANNMTAKEDGLKEDIDALKAEIEALSADITANIAAYKEQTAYAAKVDSIRDVAFEKITTTEQTSYTQEALEMLLGYDEEITAYNKSIEDAFSTGQSVAQDATIDATGEKIYAALQELVTGWEDSVDKAMSQDNLDNHSEFLDMYTLLAQTYTAAVDTINYLQTLPFAEDESVVAAFATVVGDDGVFNQSTTILALKDEENAAYTAAQNASPREVFDADEYIQSAKDEITYIEDATQAYIDAVNAVAAAQLQAAIDAAETALATAKADAETNGLTVSFTETEKLIAEAQDLIDGMENNKSFAADVVDELAKFEDVESLINTELETAASTEFNKAYETYKAIADGDAAATFLSEDDQADLASLVETTLDEAKSTFTGYDTYAEAVALLKNFADATETRTVDEAEVTHTTIYWNAQEADALQTEMETQYAALEASATELDTFINSLIVRNDATLNSDLNTIETRLATLEADIAAGTYTSLEDFETEKSAIEDLITNYYSDAVAAENAALAEQKANVQNVYDRVTGEKQTELIAAIADGDEAKQAEIQAELAAIDEAYKGVIATYDTKADSIGNAFLNPGKDEEGNDIEAATSTETSAAYVALEAEIAKAQYELTQMLSTGDDEIAAAMQEVQDAIAAYTEVYNSYTEAYNDAHEPVQTAEADDYNNATTPDQFTAALSEETVLLYKDVILSDIAEATAYAETNIDEINDADEVYDTNDAVYADKLAAIEDIASQVETIYNTSAEYLGVTYTREYYYEYFNGNEEEEVVGVIAELKAEAEELYNAVTIATNSTALDEAIADAQSVVDEFELVVSYRNATYQIRALETALSASQSAIKTADYTTEDQLALLATSYEIADTIAKLKAVNSAEYTEGATDEGDYMDVYADIIAQAEAIQDSIDALNAEAEEKVVVRGDVNKDNEVTVTDYSLVRQHIAGIITITDEKSIDNADVNEDGSIDAGDLVQIADNIVNGTAFTKVSSSISNAKALRFVNGTLDVTTEGTTVKIAINSSRTYVAAQFSLVLPDGVSVVGATSESHDVVYNAVDGETRVVVSNLSNTEIASGVTFVELQLDNATSDVTVNDALFATSEGRTYSIGNQVATGIDAVSEDGVSSSSTVFGANGAIQNGLKQGVNIVKDAAGKIIKMIKK